MDLREKQGGRIAVEPVVVPAAGGRPAPAALPLVWIGRIAVLLGTLLVAGTLILVATTGTETAPRRDTSGLAEAGVEAQAEEVPQVPSGREVRFLVRHGASGAQVQAANLRAWNKVESRMLADPWVVEMLRHRAGTTTEDLYRAWLSRK